MKTLILCRHAKSDWPAHVQDMDRPLKERGIKDAKRLGKWLREHDFMPDLIVSSPAQRALSTAEIAKESLRYEGDIHINRNVYFGDERSLFQVVKTLENDPDIVMVFGHNPTMEYAVRHLLQSESQFEMPTSGMACFEIDCERWSEWMQADAQLRWLLVPRMMRKGALHS